MIPLISRKGDNRSSFGVESLPLHFRAKRIERAEGVKHGDVPGLPSVERMQDGSSLAAMQQAFGYSMGQDRMRSDLQKDVATFLDHLGYGFAETNRQTDISPPVLSAKIAMAAE